MLAVVVYHVWPDLLPGGFAGVDVFFVISGFLITRLLLKELHATGRLHLVKFWARRARRILPAASLVLINAEVLSPLRHGLVEQAGQSVHFGVSRQIGV